jgi:ammonia channel protein AmtB
VDAVPVHFIGGCWGLIAPTLFMSQKFYLQMYPFTGPHGDAPCGIFQAGAYTRPLFSST